MYKHRKIVMLIRKMWLIIRIYLKRIRIERSNNSSKRLNELK